MPINVRVLSGSTSSSSMGIGFGREEGGSAGFAAAENGRILASAVGLSFRRDRVTASIVRRRHRAVEGACRFPPFAISLYSVAMRQYLALFCVWWLALSCARVPSDALQFGMTTGEVAQLYGSRMSLVAQRRHDEIYVVAQPAAVPGIYPPLIAERIYLQFRKGVLTGWKNEWEARKLWF